MRDGKGYRHVKKAWSPTTLEEHLTGNQPIAIFPVIDAETRLAVLDVDNHGGEIGWAELVAKVRPLYYELISRGFSPLAFRSGGGAGIHLWIVWEEPQKAVAVRRLLRTILGDHGFRDGTGGVSQSEIEVYPKQDALARGAVGNPIALPLGRQSRALDAQFECIELEDFFPPDLASCCSPAMPLEDDEGTLESSSNRVGAPSDRVMDVVLAGDDGEATAALKHVDADSYQIWIRIGLVLKRAFGDAGLPIWATWSQTSRKYPGDVASKAIWDGLAPRGEVGLGSLFLLAQQGGWNGPGDRVIREMNMKYGILTHRNRTLIILKDAAGPDGDAFQWLTLPTFKDRIASQFVSTESSVGEPQRKRLADYWTRHPRADHYHRIDFDPGRPPGKDGQVWNIWTGFPVAARQGDWSLLQHHILTNIVQGDEELNAWLLNWMALGVQKPSLVIGTAPVLSGLPGTGKGFLANAYGRLWGPHYTAVTNPAHVTGRFNSHFFGMRFVFIDEGTFGGNRRDAGVIKTRVTEPEIILEAKGVDPIKIKNRLIFMVASNESSIVPADVADRRWQLFETGDLHREDHSYFGGISTQLHNGGYEAMLFDLLHRNLSIGPDPTKIIKTEALFEQIIRAQGPELRYLHQVLDQGLLPQRDAPGNGPNSTTIKAMWEDLRATQARSEYVNPIGLGRFVNSVIPGIAAHQNGNYLSRPSGASIHGIERSTRYVFPALNQCRKALERRMGQAIPWTNPQLDWGGDDPI